MAVISISVIESEEQIISGIPKIVSLEANISSTIFYTLDGTEPTLFSNIYTGPIYLPIDSLLVILKFFATNGVDSSSIITESYQTVIVDSNARLPRSPTNVPPGNVIPSLYPFGDNSPPPNGLYLNPADAGITVENPALPSVSSGYNADGYKAAFTNYPYNLVNYNIVYSTTNSENEAKPYVGTLPAKVILEKPIPPPEETEQFNNLFDPRAFVIFQDFSKENPDDPVNMNRAYFSLQNDKTYRDGNAIYSTGLDSPGISGSFVKSFFNARTNTMTSYYFDSSVNRWIISTAPYSPNSNFNNNLSQMVFSKEKGAGFVFKWRPFARRVLF